MMLALVKKPRIELSIQGERADELIAWIAKKFEVSVLTPSQTDSIPVEETDFWKEMQSNRIGNLLAAARHKANLTQAQLAKRMRIRQNMISDYERGARRLGSEMAKRFAKALNVKLDYLT